MEFHEKLKTLRIRNRFTQSKIANILGISERAYQHYEAGSREPNIETLICLSLLLNVSLDDLLCREDYRKLHEGLFDEY